MTAKPTSRLIAAGGYRAAFVADNGQPHDVRCIAGVTAAEHARTSSGRVRHFPVTVSHK